MNILVSIDFSDITEQVLQQSSKLAKSMQAEIFLLHVAEPNPDHIAYDYDPAAMYVIDPSEIRDQIAQRFHKEHQTLQKYAQQLRDDGLNCRALMVQGETIEMILNGVDKLAADFIVAGTHGKGVISQILLGSTSEKLIKKSTVPVYLVPVDRSAE